MGSLHRFSRPGYAEVYIPVNFRPPETRFVIWFEGDGAHYQQLFDAVGVQYAVGEESPEGYHVIETPDADGLLIRYIAVRPDGSVCVQERKGDGTCQIYQRESVNVVGRIFQFIKNRETGERWELIIGPIGGNDGERQPVALMPTGTYG